MTTLQAVAYLAAPVTAALALTLAVAALRRIDQGIIAGLNNWDTHDGQPFSADTEAGIIQAMRVANDGPALWVCR